MRVDVPRAAIHVPGFRFAGVACGLKDRGRKDVALIVPDGPAAVAGVFTKNRLAASPVELARAHVRGGTTRAVLINTRSANAGTGWPGLERARECCRDLAGRIGAGETDVVPCSTGKIGLPLAMGKMRLGIRRAVASLSPDGFQDAAEAIRTTDAFAKTSVRTVRVGRGDRVVAALGKGAGMVHPDLATTLAFVVTDAKIFGPRLRSILKAAVDATFNTISVDGDTSTNDTVLLLAGGATGGVVARGSRDEGRIAAAVAEVLGDLAAMIVADGEGASKLVRVSVSGARSDADARRVTRAVATSTLVKTAFAGADPNWGRIACAVGYSGARVESERLVISIGDVVVARAAMPVGAAAERRARRAMKRPEFAVRIDLGLGRGEHAVLTCDLGMNYVRFNSEYSS